MLFKTIFKIILETILENDALGENGAVIRGDACEN
jgi:hypothetical protein